jgi:hypothetical protein
MPPQHKQNAVASIDTEALRERVRMIPVGEIEPSHDNARTHSSKQIRHIAESIRVFGFTSPLLVDEHLNLIAGHGRYAAALSLRMSEIPVLVLSGLSAAKRRALAIADNRIAEGARWDQRRLAIEIPELTELLSAEQLDISILGFEPIEIDKIRLAAEEPAPGSDDRGRSHDDIDAAWGRKAAVSCTGDLWILDQHKLLCGEGRSAADLERLMGDDRAAMAFIDSGYGMREEGARGGLGVALEAAAAVSRAGAVHFVCTGWEGAGDLAAAAKGAGRRVLDVVVCSPSIRARRRPSDWRGRAPQRDSGAPRSRPSIERVALPWSDVASSQFSGIASLTRAARPNNARRGRDQRLHPSQRRHP